ncbi:MAG: hypothetical protein K6G50_12925 [bacterium]|nr:hypothetical protein [bacterium]
MSDSEIAVVNSMEIKRLSMLRDFLNGVFYYSKLQKNKYISEQQNLYFEEASCLVNQFVTKAKPIFRLLFTLSKRVRFLIEGRYVACDCISVAV